MIHRILSAVFAFVIVASAASKPSTWQSGMLEPVHVIKMFRERHAFDTALVPIIIHTQSFTYRAQEWTATTTHQPAEDAADVVSLARKADPDMVPWTADLPPVVQFTVVGKKLYYLDGKNHRHTAKLLSQIPNSL